jgi:ABC-type Fe3+-hydroxamate transport system substrate-binding protein
MQTFTDQVSRQIALLQTPARIISLVPSQTELLYDLDLRDEVVGITKFCVHPAEWFRSKTRIGGTKQLHIDKIHQLKPDLIIANKEENVKDQVEELALHYPVWISDVNDLTGVYEMIRQVGAMTGKSNKAGLIVNNIKDSFTALTTNDSRPTTIYLIWRDPYMTVGGDTFIHAMMDIAGFENVYGDHTRYPEIAIEDIRAKNPKLLLLSSEPFPFKQKHIEELQLHLPNTLIILVDGEMFSWYGSRLLKAATYFKDLNKTTTGI